MAASAFQSTAAGRAHIMVATRTGIELARRGGLSLLCDWSLRTPLESDRAEL